MIKEQGNFIRESGENYGTEYYRSDTTRGKANAGLALGIVGTALGAAALWRRNGGGLTSLIDGGTSSGVPANVNINGCGGGNAPTTFEVYSKSCGDALDLTKAFYNQRIASMNEATKAREADIAEKFSLYKGQFEADFGLYVNNRDNIDKVNNRINDELFSLYKYTRDKDDATNKELAELKSQVAVNSAIRPYQDKLIQSEIEKAYTAAINYIDRRMCRVPQGVVVLPNNEVTGFGCGCNGSSAA